MHVVGFSGDELAAGLSYCHYVIEDAFGNLRPCSRPARRDDLFCRQHRAHLEEVFRPVSWRDRGRRGDVSELEVLRARNLHARAVHPTEKPVGIIVRLLECSLRPGGVALDPFAGSGSTLVAAKLRGARAIGIEIEERYCEVAVKRLAQEVLPLEPAMD